MASASLSKKMLDIVNRVTCKISTSDDTGTGIIVRLFDDSLIILTVKHIFETMKDIQDIKLSFYIDKDNFFEYCFQNGDKYIESDKEDVAILEVKRDNINNNFYNMIDFESIKFIKSNYVLGTSRIRGFPLGAEEEPTNIIVEYLDYNRIQVVKILNSDSLDISDLYKGVSGSGVFCQQGDCLYISGIAFFLKEDYQILYTNDLAFYAPLFEKLNKPKMVFSRPLFFGEIEDDIETLLKHTNEVLATIKGTIGNVSLERVSLKKQLKQYLNSSNTVIVTGEAGAGKSALAKEALIEIEEHGDTILAFKADSFGVKTLGDFSNSISLKSHIEKAISALTSYSKTTILIDSLEKILDIRDRGAIEAFLRFCGEQKNIRIVLTTRAFCLTSLMIDFDWLLPKPHQNLDIPFLESKELEPVIKEYPELLSSIPEKYKSKVTKVPFFLDLVVRNFKDNDNDTQYLDFFSLIWNKVITKGKNSRAECLTNLAIERATSMTLHVRLADVPDEVIKKLIEDNVIVPAVNDDTVYSPAHDIFEDFGLINYIDKMFDESDSEHTKFIERLDGSISAIRRAYRLWLNRKLENINHDLKRYIDEVLHDNSLEQFWHDETITALLKSDYLQQFLEEYRDSFISNDGFLFKRFLKMLTVTCQEPDYSLLKWVSKSIEDLNYFDYFIVKPTGSCWEQLLLFFIENRESLKSFYYSIVELIVEFWIKKVNESNLTSNDKLIGSLLISYINNYKKIKLEYESYSWDSEERKQLKKKFLCSKKGEKLFGKSIIVIFRLAEIFQDEIEVIVKDAMTFSDRRKRAVYADYILDKALSFEYSEYLCQYLPDLVLEAAQHTWLDKSDKDDYYSSYGELERAFGIKKKHDFFPAGLYKTPIFHILRYHAWKAFRFLIDFFNYVTEMYVQSGFEEHLAEGSSLFNNDKEGIPVEVKMVFDDGKVVKQYGNPLLWCIYRGTYRASPYLLQSLLMSLEKYLLNLAEYNTDLNAKVKLFSDIFSYLLSNSNSVAITSVLVSIGIAHPELVSDSFLPIFKVKQFFSWDIYRHVGEVEANTLASFDRHNRFAQAERIKSNNLPHRKHDLEHLMKQKQLSPLKEKIFAILDECKDKLSKGELDWKNKLTRIDIRNWEPGEIGRTEDGDVMVEIDVKQEEDVVRYLEEFKRKNEEKHKMLEIMNWAGSCLKRKGGMEASLSQWNKYYDYIINEKESELAQLKDYTGFAVIGISKFITCLTDEQKKYSIESIFTTLRSQFNMPWERYRIQHGLFTTECIDVLPDIFRLVDDEIKDYIIYILLMLLQGIDINGDEDKHLLNSIDKIRSQKSDVVLSIYNGLLNLYTYYQKNPPHRLRSIDISVLEDSFNEIIINNLLEVRPTIELESICFDRVSVFLFERAVKLLPFMDNVEISNSIFMYILKIFFDYDRKLGSTGASVDSLDFELSWQKSYVDFLYKIPSENAMIFFRDLLKLLISDHSKNDWFTNKDLLNILSKFILKVDLNNDLVKRFWTLWNVLYEVIMENKDNYVVKHLIPGCFLAIDWKSNATDWSPLKEQVPFFRKVYREFTQDYFKDAVRLLSGIGVGQLLPDGLSWIMEAIREITDVVDRIIKDNLQYSLEQLVQRVYYLKRKELQESKRFKKEMIELLDILIEVGSPVSYVIRDRVLSLQVFDDMQLKK